MTEEQKIAYNRFIKARDRVGLVRTATNRRNPWIRLADVVETIDVPNLNHPLFVENEEWLDYKEAVTAWLAVEPQYRKDERMRMSRGDYGTQDSWDEKGSKVSDVYNKVKGL
jgi:hypothetical protein